MKKRRIEAAIIDTYNMNFFSKFALQKIQEFDRISKIHFFGISPLNMGEIFHHINPISSTLDYSRFLIESVPYFTSADYLLVFQWDGFSINPGKWNESFLEYDFIGARWLDQPHNISIGNGGFSLRSQKYLQACRKLKVEWEISDAEDVVFNRIYRKSMENLCIKYCTSDIADNFSYEDKHYRETFGFHGVYNLPYEMGEELLCLNISEFLERTSHPFFYAKTISNAMNNKMNVFSNALIESIRLNPELFSNVNRYFRN